MLIFTSHHVFLLRWVSPFRYYSTSFGCDPDIHQYVQNMGVLTVRKERMKSGPSYFANNSVFLCIPG